jgi:hypothetical protein
MEFQEASANTIAWACANKLGLLLAIEGFLSLVKQIPGARPQLMPFGEKLMALN